MLDVTSGTDTTASCKTAEDLAGKLEPSPEELTPPTQSAGTRTMEAGKIVANIRRVARTLSVTLALVNAAACGNSINGTGTATTSASAPANPASSSPNPFATLDQCQLVDQILSGQGFPPARPSIADANRSCRTKRTSVNAAKDPAAEVGIALQDGQKYTDNVLDPHSAHNGNINGRKLIEQRDLLGSPGGCQIGMEVGPDSRALVIVLIGDDTAAACEKAEDVATALDKLLPRN
ncbi:DUF3558 family protein [Amycolatopsis silviterrae]|uniref:DUF3558 family protein n=1 Tax=Amycolatopsis silviterrae TaxID=1656914 RepID=A0ABW5H0S8_9PSEU